MGKNNTSRELFLLFPYLSVVTKGYTLIHCLKSMNDEPPYVMCSFWDITSNYDLQQAAEIDYDSELEDRHYSFYLIRTQDANRFISIMNNSEKGRLEGYYQYQLERSYGDNSLTNNEIDSLTRRQNRRPRIKFMDSTPNLSLHQSL